MTTTIPTWTLGDRLTKAREMADISVSDMAARLRVHRNTISNWENDKVVPPYAAVLAWSVAASRWTLIADDRVKAHGTRPTTAHVPPFR